MSKRLKALMADELTLRFRGMEACLVVDPQGIDGVTSNALHRALLGKRIEFLVVKNSLAKRALGEVGLGAVGSLLRGPAALVWGGDSIVDVAREVLRRGKELNALEVRGGYLEGTALSAPEVEDLSRWPSRVELQGQIVQLALSPGAGVASAIASPGGKIAACIAALVEQLESRGSGESEAA